MFNPGDIITNLKPLESEGMPSHWGFIVESVGKNYYTIIGHYTNKPHVRSISEIEKKFILKD
jgi:hypothetical protein